MPTKTWAEQLIYILPNNVHKKSGEFRFETVLGMYFFIGGGCGIFSISRWWLCDTVYRQMVDYEPFSIDRWGFEIEEWQ